MQYFRQAHAVYRTQYHLVWISRFRRKILVPGVAAYLETKLDEVRKWHPDIAFLERTIKPDHVHLLVLIPPKYRVSDVVGMLKTNTSRALKKHFRFLAHVYLDGGGIWSVGYFASTVGVNEQIIRRYLRLQEREDSGQAKLVLQKKPRA